MGRIVMLPAYCGGEESQYAASMHREHKGPLKRFIKVPDMHSQETAEWSCTWAWHQTHFGLSLGLWNDSVY